jgi:hypothetical protein
VTRFIISIIIGSNLLHLKAGPRDLAFEISGWLLGCGELADYLHGERPACCGLVVGCWWRGLGRSSGGATLLVVSSP